MKARIVVLALSLTWATPTSGQPPAAKPLVISVGATIRLQMSTKQRIKVAQNENATVARVTESDDPTAVLVTGLAPGRTLITLTDEDGKKEVHRMGPKSK